MVVFVCLGILTRIALPGIIVSYEIPSVWTRLLFTTIATPAALFVSGRGEWYRASLVLKDVLTLSASSFDRCNSWIARIAMRWVVKILFISNHFSWRKPLVVLVLPRMFRDAILRLSLVVVRQGAITGAPVPFGGWGVGFTTFWFSP